LIINNYHIWLICKLHTAFLSRHFYQLYKVKTGFLIAACGCNLPCSLDYTVIQLRKLPSIV